MADGKHILIIGAGFSGTMVATHLLRLAPRGTRLTLIDRTGNFGRGVAYGTTDPHHLLNVPAAKMSAFQDEPSHFLDWTRENGGSGDALAFLPRALYGRYLESVLSDAERNSEIPFERLSDEAVDATPLGKDRVMIRLKSGRDLLADQVVLAVGNLPPSQSASFMMALRPDNTHYVNNIWTSPPWKTIPKMADVLILGTGLTMVDAVTSLKERGHTGKIRAISRRGLLPAPHKGGAVCHGFLNPAEIMNMRQLLMRVRGEIEVAAGLGHDWRAVIDALRPLTPMLWRMFPLKEKRRFLRHLRPYWEVARHRLSPEIHEQLKALLASGQLTVSAGRVTACAEAKGGKLAVTIAPRGSKTTEVIATDFIVSCTGPDCDYRRPDQPLLRNLLFQGEITPDALAMGLQTDEEGRTINSAGEPSSVFLTLGPPLKGQLWETTAVPELRGQAEELARLLASRC